MKICVFGAASSQIDKHYKETAKELCRKMAEKGHELVFGGGDHGMMGAVARGFHEGGGKVTGVVPKFFREDDIEDLYEQCDEFIYTETMAERKAKMEDLADVFVIVPGGIGTFEEFFEVLTLKQINRHNKAMALYNINGYYDKMQEMLKVSIDQYFLHENCLELFHIFSEGEEGELIKYLEADQPETVPVNELKYG